MEVSLTFGFGQYPLTFGQSSRPLGEIIQFSSKSLLWEHGACIGGALVLAPDPNMSGLHPHHAVTYYRTWDPD